jgi:hypothetical protein
MHDCGHVNWRGVVSVCLYDFDLGWLRQSVTSLQSIRAFSALFQIGRVVIVDLTNGNLLRKIFGEDVDE